MALILDGDQLDEVEQRWASQVPAQEQASDHDDPNADAAASYAAEPGPIAALPINLSQHPALLRVRSGIEQYSRQRLFDVMGDGLLSAVETLMSTGPTDQSVTKLAEVLASLTVVGEK